LGKYGKYKTAPVVQWIGACSYLKEHCPQSKYVTTYYYELHNNVMFPLQQYRFVNHAASVW
jgi:hypothetical protein